MKGHEVPVLCATPARTCYAGGVVRPATLRRLSWLGSVVAATAGCGQSTRSSESRGSEDSGGSAGQAGTTAGGGSGGSASATGGSVAGGTAGAAGASTAGSGNPAGAPGVDISGAWAMFHFEDPVGVSLGQTGTVLTGRGCCVGLNPGPPVDQCCGQVVDGSIVERRAQFGFTFEFGGTIGDYFADVLVSSDGQRMMGAFSRTDATMAWVRITDARPEEIGWLRSTDVVLDEVLLERMGSYRLTLTDAPQGGDDYSLDVAYLLQITRSHVPIVSGDLGPFWSGEMTWQEGEQTLVLGPVPTTDPAFPIGLRLRFEDVVLSAVEAQMPSGDRYLFSATPQ